MNSTSRGTAKGQGSEGALKCMGPERSPCTEEMVREMDRRTAERSSEHPVLASRQKAVGSKQ